MDVAGRSMVSDQHLSPLSPASSLLANRVGRLNCVNRERVKDVAHRWHAIQRQQKSSPKPPGRVMASVASTSGVAELTPMVAFPSVASKLNQTK